MGQSTSKSKYLILGICVIGIMGLGSLSGVATGASIDSWYATLTFPSFNPPNWIFGPVWSLLYFLLAYSLFRVIIKRTFLDKKMAYLFFGVQLALNFAWSFIFFYFHFLGWALAEIIILEGFILLMIYKFYQIDKTAGLINVPYALWVAFATFLNYSIYVLN